MSWSLSSYAEKTPFTEKTEGVKNIWGVNVVSGYRQLYSFRSDICLNLNGRLWLLVIS